MQDIHGEGRREGGSEKDQEGLRRLDQSLGFSSPLLLWGFIRLPLAALFGRTQYLLIIQ